jgi:hypothetical protein
VFLVSVLKLCEVLCFGFEMCIEKYNFERRGRKGFAEDAKKKQPNFGIFSATPAKSSRPLRSKIEVYALFRAKARAL